MIKDKKGGGAGLQSRQTEAWRKGKWKEDSRDVERVGGTALTPACLFYLGAQHGYGCCAAPSHRDMTASLCSHTAPLTCTHRLAAASPCCLAPSLWASLAPPLSRTHTHTHTLPWLPSLPAPECARPILQSMLFLSPWSMSVCFLLHCFFAYKNLHHLFLRFADWIFVEAKTAGQHRRLFQERTKGLARGGAVENFQRSTSQTHFVTWLIQTVIYIQAEIATLNHSALWMVKLNFCFLFWPTWRFDKAQKCREPGRQRIYQSKYKATSIYGLRKQEHTLLWSTLTLTSLSSC